MNRFPSKKLKKRIIFFLVFLGICTIPFSTYLLIYQPKPMALEAYRLSIKRSGYYGFHSDDFTTGIVYYPGGLVDPKAYAGFAQLLSESTSANVFVTQPLFNLAITDIQKAGDIIHDYPSITSWWIGGHSLGGSSAAFYGIDNLEQLQGIFFLGSYTTAEANFSTSSLPMLTIIGDHDNILNQSTYQSSVEYFSSNLMSYTIQGGNHSQFGDYGLQRGDGVATITTMEQHLMIINQFILWMDLNRSN
jgi:hypothetical protein